MDPLEEDLNSINNAHTDLCCYSEEINSHIDSQVTSRTANTVVSVENNLRKEGVEYDEENISGGRLSGGNTEAYSSDISIIAEDNFGDHGNECDEEMTKPGDSYRSSLSPRGNDSNKIVRGSFNGPSNGYEENNFKSPEEENGDEDDDDEKKNAGFCELGGKEVENVTVNEKVVKNRRTSDYLFDSDLESDNDTLKKTKKKVNKLVIKDPKEIETLTFDSYEIRTEGTENICKKIESAYLLKHLIISNCGLNRIPKIGELLQIVFERYCLETVDLSKNDLPDKTSEYIAKGIQETSSLLDLNISNNRFGDAAAQCIGTAIGKNQSITNLNISWNEIRSHASVIFIKSIMRNKTLLRLDVSWNGFGYEGALAMSEYLKKNRTLKDLNLTNNRIDWKAAGLIAEALSKNQTLQKIKLDENPLTTNGCMDIIDAIDSNKNTSLVYLGLKKVPVISDFQIAVDYIKNKKEFVVEHGGIVGSHDVAGFKPEKRVTAIEKVVEFINEKKMRKTEFFRQLDINTEGNLNPEKLRERLKKTMVGLPDHEINELIQFLMEDDHSNSNIDFKKIAIGVKDFQNKQRLEKIYVVEEKAKTKELHEKILEI